MNKEKFLKVNNQVLEFVLNLSDKEIDEVLEGKKKLGFIGEVKTENTIDSNTKTEQAVKKDKKEIEIDNTIEKLNKVETVKEAKELLYRKELTIPMLKKIGKRENISFLSKDAKGIIVDKIIEGTIGIKLRKEGLSK